MKSLDFEGVVLRDDILKCFHALCEGCKQSAEDCPDCKVTSLYWAIDSLRSFYPRKMTVYDIEGFSDVYKFGSDE